jgi:hypothetical protein
MSSFSVPSMFSALLKTPKKLKRVAKALSEALLSTPTPSPSKRKQRKRARVAPVLEPGLAKDDTPSLFHPPPGMSPKKLFENDDRPKELLRTSATVTPLTKQAAVIEAYRQGYKPGEKNKNQPALKAAIIVSFERGFVKPIDHRKISKWEAQGRSGTQGLKSKQNRAIIIGELVSEEAFLEAYRKIEDHDPRLTLEEWARELSTILGVPITRRTFKRWFKKKKGKRYKDVSRPRLTLDNMAVRLEWCRIQLAVVDFEKQMVRPPVGLISPSSTNPNTY